MLRSHPLILEPCENEEIFAKVSVFKFMHEKQVSGQGFSITF
jgi:hypothetical protein